MILFLKFLEWFGVLVIALTIFLVGLWFVLGITGCTTTGIRNGDEVHCKSGLGGGRVHWADGTTCQNGPWPHNFSAGVRLIQSEANRNVRLAK